MTIKIIEGNLINAFGRGDVDVMCHCCNAQGKMNSGIAKSIRETYPLAYKRYMHFYNEGKLNLGDVIGVNIGWESDNSIIYNMVGQEFYGYDGKRYLNYGAIAKCLQSVSERTNHVIHTIGFPYLMGCDRAGGDWDIVLGMIDFYFKNHKVKIYKLEK